MGGGIEGTFGLDAADEDVGTTVESSVGRALQESAEGGDGTRERACYFARLLLWATATLRGCYFARLLLFHQREDAPAEVLAGVGGVAEGFGG
jgi:hypothetical protein